MFNCEFPYCDQRNLVNVLRIACVCGRKFGVFCYNHSNHGVMEFLCSTCVADERNKQYNYINHIKYGRYWRGPFIEIYLEITCDEYLIIEMCDMVKSLDVRYGCMQKTLTHNNVIWLKRTKSCLTMNDLKQFTYAPLLAEMYAQINDYISVIPKDIVGVIETFLFNKHMFQI